MPDLDLPAAHKYFAAHCFNTAWDLLDNPVRSPDEDLGMLARSFASYYHWTQREDFDATAHSVALWQLARIYAVLDQPENALRFAERCLEVSRQDGVGPFFRACAHEALARAYKLLGDQPQFTVHLAAAQELSVLVPDPDDRDSLLADLNALA
jgi:hypothetical protein